MTCSAYTVSTAYMLPSAGRTLSVSGEQQPIDGLQNLALLEMPHVKLIVMELHFDQHSLIVKQCNTITFSAVC